MTKRDILLVLREAIGRTRPILLGDGCDSGCCPGTPVIVVQEFLAAVDEMLAEGAGATAGVAPPPTMPDILSTPFRTRHRRKRLKYPK